MLTLFTTDGSPIETTMDEDSANYNGTYSPTLHKKFRQSAYPPLFSQIDQICKCLSYLKATGIDLGPDGTALLAARAAVVAQFPKPTPPAVS